MYSVSIISDEHLFKLKLLYRKALPTNQVFFLVLFILKYFPTIAFTHAILPNYPPGTLIYSISSLIQALMIFKPSYTINYFYLCIILYSIIFILIISTTYIFYKVHYLSQRSDIKLYNIPTNKLNMSKQFKYLFHITCILYFILIFFYQHIIEVFYYGIFLLIHKDFSNEHYFTSSIISQFTNDFHYGITITNIVLIIISITCMYFFMILSSNRTISQTYGFQSSMSPICVFTSIILFSMQGVYSMLFYFDNVLYRNKLSIIVTYILVGVLFINAVSNFKQTNYNSHCLVDYFLRFINNFCFVSGIMELIVYYLYPNSQKNSQVFYIIKLLFDVVNAVMITWLFTLIQKNIAIKSVIKNFFNSNRTFQFENLFNFYLLLKNCETFQEKYFFIFELLQLHRQRCSEEKCECRNHDKFFNSNFEVEKFESAINVFLSISEDKITTAIVNFSKDKNTTTMTKLFLLHIDYLFSIKQNVPLTLYLSQYYLIQHKKELSFNDAYFIYEINYILIKRYRSLNKELSFIKKNMIIEKIQKIILQLCEYMEKIFYYKSLKNANAKMDFTCEDILYSLIKYVKQNMQLKKLITFYSNQDIFEHSIELKYIIVYFIKLFNMRLHKSILHKIYHGKCQFPTYSEIELNNAENNVDKSNYIVLFLRHDNKWVIKYLSLEIAEMLQYTKSELINNDFNEIMIPKAIQNYHSIYMKQFTLSGLSSYKASTFLVNKSLQLIPVDVKCIVLPTKNTLYTLFIKVQKNKSNVYTQSHLLLDMSYQLWAMSESFENNFLFSLDMLKMIKFNFCDFFGINKETINSYFKDTKQQAKHITNIQEEGDTFDHVKLSKIKALPTVRKEELKYYRYIDFDLFKNKITKQQRIRNVKLQIVPKEKIINSVVRLRKNIDEMGLEREWKLRLNELYLKLTAINPSKNETMIHITNNSQTNGLITINKSNNYNGFKFSTNVSYGNYYIKLHLKKLGDILYFVTTILDIIDDDNNHVNDTFILKNRKLKPKGIIIRNENDEEQLFLNNNNTTTKRYKLNLSSDNYNNSSNSNSSQNKNTTIKNNEQLIIPTMKHPKRRTYRKSIGNITDVLLLANSFNNNKNNTSLSKFNESQGSINNYNYSSINSTANNNNNSTINDSVNFFYSRNNSNLGFISRHNSFELSSTSHNLTSSNILNKNNYIFNFSGNSTSSNNYLSLIAINNKEKQIFIFRYVIMIFIIIVFILNIVNIFLNNISTKYSLNLFYINAYTFLLTNDIYYGVLACINTCLVKDEIQTGDLNKLYDKTQQSSADLIEHFQLLTYYMNSIVSNDEISKIFKIFNKENEFHYITKNWVESIKRSTLLEEIYYIHYHLKMFNNQNELCRVTKVFFNKQFKDFVNNNNNNGDVILPTSEETFIYYICSNIVSGISILLEELMKTVNTILHDNNNKDNLNSLILNIAIIISSFILYGSSIFIIQSSRFLFKGKMIYLFSKQENEELFYENIQKFKKLLKCFNIDECNKYTEYHKTSNSQGVQLNSIKLTRSPHNTLSKSVEPHHYQTSGKQFILNKKDKSHNNHNNNLTFNLKVMKNHNASKKQLKRALSEYSTEELHNKIIITNQLFRKRAEPKFALRALILITIMFIIIFSIEIAGTFISLNAHTELTTENHLATSFLSRGPKINELFLYSIISVIMNDIEYISKDQSIYDLYILSNYYNIELNINSNSIFNSFGKSNYAYLYYQLYIIRQNINYFVNDNDMKQFLVNTVKKEFLFEKNENFCLYSSLEYLQYYTKDASLSQGNDFVNEWNDLVKTCRLIGSGINLSGYQAALDVMLDQLSNHYYNFKLNKDKGFRQEDFLKNKDIIVIQQNTINILRTLHIADSYSAIDDVAKSYHDSHNVKIIFLIISICFCSGIIVLMIVVIILRFSFYIKIINEIGIIFERAIQNYNKHIIYI